MALTPKLTAKQELFCKEYLIDLNATQAAIRAGYSVKTAKEQGFENLTKPHIQEKVSKNMQERSQRVECDADWVLSRLKEIDSLDILDIMNEDLDSFKPLSLWPKPWRTSISGIDISTINSGDDIESVIKKIKWPDKTKNLELIGKHNKVKAFEKEEQKQTQDTTVNINFTDAIKPE